MVVVAELSLVHSHVRVEVLTHSVADMSLFAHGLHLRLLGHLNLLVKNHVIRTLNVVAEVLSLHLLHRALLDRKIVVEVVIPSLRHNLSHLVVSLSCELVGLHDSIHSQDLKVSVLFKGFLV